MLINNIITIATPLPFCSLPTHPSRTSPSQFHSRPPPGQQLPLKNCTIGKKLSVTHLFYLSPYITHINKTRKWCTPNQPWIFIAILFIIISDDILHYWSLFVFIVNNSPNLKFQRENKFTSTLRRLSTVRKRNKTKRKEQKDKHDDNDESSAEVVATPPPQSADQAGRPSR